MSVTERTIDTWTCDRCGVSVEQAIEGGDEDPGPPAGWMPARRGGLATWDLCRDCWASLVEWRALGAAS